MTKKEQWRLFERIFYRYAFSNNGCWPWNRGKNKKGYGQISLGGKQIGAHRAVYQAFKGKINDDMVIMHSCDNPVCVNPNHLSEGSQSENLKQAFIKNRARSYNSKKTHCSKGHAFSGENLSFYKNNRICKACARIKSAIHRLKTRPRIISKNVINYNQ